MSVDTQIKNAFAQSFNQLKEDITRIVVTKSWDSDDDLQESESTSSIEGVVQVFSLDDIQELGGKFDIGDAQAFFEADQTINIGDKITHDGVTYKVDTKTPEYASGLGFIEVFLKRVDD